MKRKTLEIYNEFKKHIQEETYYNEESSLIIFKMRTNTLRLNDRNRHVGGNVSCVCGHEIEDLEHFLLDCPMLEKERIKILRLQRPQEENRKEIIGKLLFKESRDCERQIYDMWKLRNILLPKQ